MAPSRVDKRGSTVSLDGPQETIAVLDGLLHILHVASILKSIVWITCTRINYMLSQPTYLRSRETGGT